MRRILGVLAVVALGAAVLAWPAAKLADGALGTDAVALSRVFDPATVELNRAAYDGDGLTGEDRTRAVAEIYGVAGSLAADRFVGVAEADLIRPAEAPELALLQPREGGWRQVKTFYFLAERLIVGGVVGAVALLLARRFLTGGVG